MATVETIKATLGKRESDELEAIWIEHDFEQWSPEAFNAIQQILIERGIPIPAAGGSGAAGIRRLRSDAAKQRRSDTKARVGRGGCYILGAIGSLFGIALIGWLASGFLEALPNTKAGANVVAIIFTGLFFWAWRFIAALLIARFARTNDRPPDL